MRAKNDLSLDLELDKLFSAISKSKAKTVLIQLPDGLKPKAKEITDILRKKTSAKIIIWAGSCFGACDTPKIEHLDFDLLIHFGHSEWK